VDDAEQEAVAAQLAEMREHLLRDAAVAGTPADAVNAAVDEVAAGYADAQVASFIGVLVGSARSGNSGSLCGPPTSGCRRLRVRCCAGRARRRR